jgi:chromosome segregation ATPase
MVEFLDSLIPEKFQQAFRQRVIEPAEREHEEQRTTERRRLQSECDRISAEITSRSPALGAAKEKEAEAERNLRQAEADLRTTSFERERVQFEIFELRDRLETLTAQSAQNCAPAIDAFVAEHWKLFDKIRNRIHTEERLSEPHFLSGKRTQIYVTNKHDIDCTLGKIRSAVDAANKLRGEILSDAEVQAKLDRLRVVEPAGGFSFERVEVKAKNA